MIMKKKGKKRDAVTFHRLGGKLGSQKHELLTKNIFVISLVFLLTLLGLLFISPLASPTGWVVIGNGDTVTVNQNIADPAYGVAKGTLDFILSDNGVAVGTSPGENYTLFFSKETITNTMLIRGSNGTFTGNLTNVDGDGSGARCNPANYTTLLKYYDENNNHAEDPSEKNIYAIVTDATGCFAVKVKAGNNNIYG